MFKILAAILLSLSFTTFACTGGGGESKSAAESMEKAGEAAGEAAESAKDAAGAAADAAKKAAEDAGDAANKAMDGGH